MVLTVEEFVAMDLPEGKVELVRGELRLTPPAGGAHGAVTANIVVALFAFVRQHGLGRVFGDAVGYRLRDIPNTVRAPDASFVRADRLPANGIGPGLLELAPDLGVEVLSPDQTASALDEKLDDYFIAGTRLVWVVDPRRRTIMIVSPAAPLRWIGETDTLDGGDVLPGFRCPVDELFDGVARQ